AVVSLPARGRPPQAAARRAGLRSEEKVVTTGNCSADCLGVSASSSQGHQRWHFSDLVLLQMVPEDSWWPVRLGAQDGLVWGDEKVHTEVVNGFGKGLVHHLEPVDRGSQHRVWPNHASLDQ